ncbi:uncharacterized protein LOC121398967 [Xenopus laevis]|uniref:Uncharacterized protein LOC121398967 n=2 Tax=Xenopus laevis TaxID=8355 RepID=A0A1L8ERE2_XENLA|nr:uncharacterized protein LOC121398967 [Xenopus laevis]OCT61914.1 hypothetical protein XELAEV_18047947mg [Xenopus laevis]
MEHNQLRDNIQNFSLNNCPQGNQGYNRVLLQLFGLVGHGKSALINSLKYVLSKGNFKVHADSGNIIGGAKTMERRAYELTSTITVVDNRGLAKMTDLEMRMIYAQLGNFMPLNEKVEWKDGYEDFIYKLEDSELDPNYTDFIVPVFIYKVRAALPEQVMSQIKAFFKICRDMTGVFPIVGLTFKTTGNYFEVEKVFRCLGAEVVVAVENYSKEDQLQTLGRNTDFLTLLKHVLDNVMFRMEHPRKPKEDRIQRKKILIKYSHDFDVTEKIKALKINQKSDKAEEHEKELETLRQEAREARRLAAAAMKQVECDTVSRRHRNRKGACKNQ